MPPELLCFSFLPHTVYLRGGLKNGFRRNASCSNTPVCSGAMPSYPSLQKSFSKDITVLTVGSPKILRCADDASIGGRSCALTYLTPDMIN